MKNKYFSMFIAIVIFWGCSSNNSQSENESNTKEGKTNESAKELEIDMDGPILEMKVISFDINQSRTEIEIINRSEEDIVNIRGRLIFIDSDGNKITWANGRRKGSSFQQMSNPHIVKSKSKAMLVLLNKIEPGTAEVVIGEISGDTRDGERIAPEQE